MYSACARKYAREDEARMKRLLLFNPFTGVSVNFVSSTIPAVRPWHLLNFQRVGTHVALNK